MFRDYKNGSSANAIAQSLNVAGLTTSRGLEWKAQAIGKLLDSPVYAALSLVDDDFVDARWPAIVSRRTWNAVRRRRESDPRRTTNLGKPRPRSPICCPG